MAYSISPDRHLRPPAGGSAKRLRLAVAGGVRAPERARAWLHNGASWLPLEITASLQLLVSELVTNAVRHGGADPDQVIEIEVRAIDGGVGVEVTDPGPGFAPADRSRPMDDPGGWGLVLVDQMTERWGVIHDGRTRVWFELAA
jgi:anti-sigma regulatory factor (Ser/Thr protein kinase)